MPGQLVRRRPGRHDARAAPDRSPAARPRRRRGHARTSRRRPPMARCASSGRAFEQAMAVVAGRTPGAPRQSRGLGPRRRRDRCRSGTRDRRSGSASSGSAGWARRTRGPTATSPSTSPRAASGRDSSPSPTTSRRGSSSRRENFGFETGTLDWRELIARDDIDVVDITAPNALHQRDSSRRRRRPASTSPARSRSGSRRRRPAAIEAAARRRRGHQRLRLQLPLGAARPVHAPAHRRRPARRPDPLPRPLLLDVRARPARAAVVALPAGGGRLRRH